MAAAARGWSGKLSLAGLDNITRMRLTASEAVAVALMSSFKINGSPAQPSAISGVLHSFLLILGLLSGVG